MKTIFNTIILLLIFVLFSSAITTHSFPKRTFLIQSSDKNISPDILLQSVEIISRRLKDFGAGNCQISAIQEKNQISIVFDDDSDFQEVENLLIHKGAIGFYETYNHDSLVELLNGDNHLISLLKKSEKDNSGTKIGCTSFTEAGNMVEYLRSLETNGKCKFVWTQDFDASDICLYALKVTNEAGPLITGNDIESANSDHDLIQIILKKQVVGKWSDATRRNLNKVIAIVLDDYVISAPKVMSVIDSGKIEITGNFTNTQAGYIAALLNNGVLPVAFFVVH